MSLSRASVHHDETRGKSTRGVVRFGARQMVRLRATRKTATNNANPMGQSCGVAIITSHHRAEESALDGVRRSFYRSRKRARPLAYCDLLQIIHTPSNSLSSERFNATKLPMKNEVTGGRIAMQQQRRQRHHHDGTWCGPFRVVIALVGMMAITCCDGFAPPVQQGLFRLASVRGRRRLDTRKGGAVFWSPPSSSSNQERPSRRTNQPANHKNDKNVLRRFYKVVANDKATTNHAPPAIIVYDDFPLTIHNNNNINNNNNDGKDALGDKSDWMAHEWERLREDLAVEEQLSATTITTTTTGAKKAVVATTTHPELQQQQPPPSAVVASTNKVVSAATARWLLIVSAALYGTNFAVVKSLVEVVPPEVLGTLRFGLAALATLPWLWPTSMMKRNNSDNGQSYWQSDEWGSTIAGLEVGAWTSIGYVAQAVGLGTTLASTSAFVCSLAVVVVPVLDLVLSRGQKRAKPEQWVGIVLALIGVALLEFGGGESLAGLGHGDWISMIQPLVFGVGFIRMEAAMRKYPAHAKRTTAGQLLAVFLGSALFMAISSSSEQPLLWSDQILQTLHNPLIWAGLVWTGLVTTALTVYMETVALQTLSAAETTLIFSTEPLWGSLTAAWLLSESFGGRAIMGGGLIVAACLVSSLGVDGLTEFFVQRSRPNSTKALDQKEEEQQQ
jgi:drug/metabolite transporter (DMT)-like permease